MTSKLRFFHRPLASMVAAAASVLAMAMPHLGRADDGANVQNVEPRPDPAKASLAAAAAIVPGLVVHGSGHFVAGDPRTGSKLLVLETIGLGTLSVGFVPIVLSGASRRLVGPAAALSVVGAGIFAISALADLYGVLAPRGGTGAPSHLSPLLQTEIGLRYVYNPVFSYRDFIVYGVDYRPGRWRVHPAAWFALDDSTSRVRVPLGYRLIGPTSGGPPVLRDASSLDLETAVTRQADLPDRFVTTTAELSINGRLDMQRIAPSLTGSFAEMGLGFAGQNYHYKVKGAASDVGELLLARFGYGIYIGWPRAARGEIMVYYDHRHDDFAAGLKLHGLGSGVAGHFGIEGRAYLTDHWGFSAEAMAGSAYVTGLSVLFRHGDRL